MAGRMASAAAAVRIALSVVGSALAPASAVASGDSAPAVSDDASADLSFSAGSASCDCFVDLCLVRRFSGFRRFARGRSFVLGGFRVRGVVAPIAFRRRGVVAAIALGADGRFTIVRRLAVEQLGEVAARLRAGGDLILRRRARVGQGTSGGKIGDSDATLATALTSRRGFRCALGLQATGHRWAYQFFSEIRCLLIRPARFRNALPARNARTGKNCPEYFRTRANKHFPSAGAHCAAGVGTYSKRPSQLTVFDAGSAALPRLEC